MAVLGSGTSGNATWAVDYDPASQTVGITCTGTANALFVDVTITATGKTFSLDCLHGAAGNTLNAGRVVLAGPGSVLGQSTPVPQSAIPVLVKGQARPYTFDSSGAPGGHLVR